MSGYTDWQAAGEPWEPARPIADLARTLRGHGYTVYIIGNKDHQRANPPEDHTAFSGTGWPIASPRWYVHALDVMPPSSAALPSLADLGAQLALDRNMGVPGALPIKYMNWEPRGGYCRHESWQPDHRITTSNDRGHIHLSVRSDCTLSGAMAGYDPVARLRSGGGVVAPPPPRPPTPQPTPAAPPWPGVYYQLANPMMHAPGIALWQDKMHNRGWGISVDGWFGRQSDSILRQFQQEKGLECDGVLGPKSWEATWRLPVT